MLCPSCTRAAGGYAPDVTGMGHRCAPPSRLPAHMHEYGHRSEPQVLSNHGYAHMWHRPISADGHRGAPQVPFHHGYARTWHSPVSAGGHRSAPEVPYDHGYARMWHSPVSANGQCPPDSMLRSAVDAHGHWPGRGLYYGEPENVVSMRHPRTRSSPWYWDDELEMHMSTTEKSAIKKNIKKGFKKIAKSTAGNWRKLNKNIEALADKLDKSKLGLKINDRLDSMLNFLGNPEITKATEAAYQFNTRSRGLWKCMYQILKNRQTFAEQAEQTNYDEALLVVEMELEVERGKLKEKKETLEKLTAQMKASGLTTKEKSDIVSRKQLMETWVRVSKQSVEDLEEKQKQLQVQKKKADTMEMSLDDYRTPYYEGEDSFSHLDNITSHMQEVEYVASWIEQYYKKHPDDFKNMNVDLFLPDTDVDEGDILAWKKPAKAFPATKDSVSRMRKLVDKVVKTVRADPVLKKLEKTAKDDIMLTYQWPFYKDAPDLLADLYRVPGEDDKDSKKDEDKEDDGPDKKGKGKGKKDKDKGKKEEDDDDDPDKKSKGTGKKDKDKDDDEDSDEKDKSDKKKKKK